MAWDPERTLPGTGLAPGQRIAVTRDWRSAEGHVGGIMGAYNSFNGVPCCASSFLLDDLLRKQWGFDGYVVSDCGAINDIWGRQQHHYVATPEDK